MALRRRHMILTVQHLLLRLLLMELLRLRSLGRLQKAGRVMQQRPLVLRLLGQLVERQPHTKRCNRSFHRLVVMQR